MTDPLNNNILIDKATSTHLSDLKYAKLHSPKMKSVYWQYFGFPTNENDRIITKQNVVCTLCHKVLTNHGNTTNLRAHLQHRHKELFSKICIENGIKVPQRKPPPKNAVHHIHRNKNDPIVHRIKVEYNDLTQDSNTSPTDDQLLYETMIPVTYEDDIIDNDHFTKVEVGDMTDTKSGEDSEMEMLCNQSVVRNFHTIEEVDPFLLQDSLVNMIILDLRNVDSIYDPGMTSMLRQISGQMTLPAEKKIESLIREQHSDKFTLLADQLKVHSQIKPYSFGFELWKNIEHKHYLSVYFNYTTDEPSYNLLNQLLCTYEVNKFSPIDIIFQDFNLKNCTAAIVNYEFDDNLKEFLRKNDIPIILSYDVIADKCLYKIFELPNVSSIFEEIKDIIERYTSEINSKDVEIPTINPEFPWTYYELLKFFSEQVVWPDEMERTVTAAKEVIESVSALLVSLDTLKGEEIPHSSMLSPITLKIINKKLTVTEKDSELLSILKTTIKMELENLVIQDDNLTISALLDPRFHRLITLTNLQSCLNILTHKLTKLNELEGNSRTKIDGKFKQSTQSSTTKKSNLELFFDMPENPKFGVVHTESNIELDLKRYRNEVYVSLDDSPFVWWNQFGKMYGVLKKLAQLYQCVPCVINMNFKKPVKQQIVDYQKRFMLGGNLVDAILFLNHQNKTT